MINAKVMANLTSLMNEMTTADLLILNKEVCSRIKRANSAKQQNAATAFYVGQTVSFASKQGLIIGKITKINTKTIKVSTGSNAGQWSVSPTLLRDACASRKSA